MSISNTNNKRCIKLHEKIQSDIVNPFCRRCQEGFAYSALQKASSDMRKTRSREESGDDTKQTEDED